MLTTHYYPGRSVPLGSCPVAYRLYRMMMMMMILVVDNGQCVCRLLVICLLAHQMRDNTLVQLNEANTIRASIECGQTPAPRCTHDRPTHTEPPTCVIQGQPQGHRGAEPDVYLKADHPPFDWLINCVILHHF